MSCSSLKINKLQLEIGTKMEMEHTSSKKKAEKIAIDHLCQFPNYYTELKKLEKKLSK